MEQLDPRLTAAEVDWWVVVYEKVPCMALLERSGWIVAGNEAARERLDFGETAECKAILGEQYRPALVSLTGERQRFDGSVRGRDGGRLPMSAVAQTVEHGGDVFRVIVLLERLAEAAETPNPGRLVEDLLDATPEPTAIVSDRRILHVNRAFARLIGYSVAECLGEDLTELVVPQSRMHDVEILDHVLTRSESASIESRVQTRSGEEIDVAVMVTQLRLEGHAGANLMVRYRDIRKQKQDEARLQHKALHDALTGLPNRVLFLDRLQLTLSRLRRRPDRNFALLFLDLDGFKRVNDTLGHAAGDALLVVVKDRLLRCVRPQDTVARFGGDEFALLLDEQGSVAGAEVVALRLQEEIQRPVELDGTEAKVSLSIGLAMGTTAYASAEEMMNDADSAMYAAKTQGKARHVVFEGRSSG